jgi:hypothetical protein
LQVSPQLNWQSTAIPPAWEINERLHMLSAVPMRRTQASWSKLRRSEGLPAELTQSAAEGKSVLLICPQAWMLERLWPQLAADARHVHRFLAEAGPGLAAHVLASLEAGGQIVAGTQSAWKLAAYALFDRVILVDPSHPQYEPESDPAVDARTCLLAALSRRGGSLDIVEMGLSIFDGSYEERPLSVYSPNEVVDEAEPQTGALADVNPLPEALRSGAQRRLIYFNRLGGSQRLVCMECSTLLRCPVCNGKRIHYSFSAQLYKCPDCDFSTADLRCTNCGLASIAAQSPGLEAVERGTADIIVTGSPRRGQTPVETTTVIGTAPLLEVIGDYWPAQIVFVQAEEELGINDYWPRALDMALRLAALYDNPDLKSLALVSRRMLEQLGAEPARDTVVRRVQQELKIRALALLPPSGRVIRMRIRAASADVAHHARTLLGDRLKEHAATKLLRIGGVYAFKGAWHCPGYVVNPELSTEYLQQLRWTLHREGAGLTLRAIRGPWM